MKAGKITDKDRLLIIEQHLMQGKTIRNLSLEYGVSESTLGRWLIKYRNGKLANKEHNQDK